MKYRDLVERLEAEAGNSIESSAVTCNSAPNKSGTVTIPAGGKLSKDVPPGTLNSILKQAGLK